MSKERIPLWITFILVAVAVKVIFFFETMPY